ncbi:MAG: hypothetical protein ACR2PX_23850 [Endozoicomonas sp.]|uniref:hypothetical protein n=1 Tax=Endozoicomonas sp. TaxID=1892382 RepID=UPI003D9BA653
MKKTVIIKKQQKYTRTSSEEFTINDLKKSAKDLENKIKTDKRKVVEFIEMV